MEFKIGQNVVHLSHGVGVVKSIHTQDFGNGSTDFYVLEIHDAGVAKKVFVPVESAKARMRAVVSPLKAAQVRKVLASPLDASDGGDAGMTWNRRYRDYMDRVMSGQIDDLVSVVRGLRWLAATKELSFGERKLLEQAENVIEAELGVV